MTSPAQQPARTRPRPGDELELSVDALAFGGAGIARADGYVVFVEGAIPGDRVRARVFKAKRAYGHARMVELLEPSPERIPPAADHPGAPWQVLPYERQLAVKAEQVDDALRRIGRLDGFALEPIVPAVQEWRYRNKLEYSFGTGPDGGLVCGFHAPGRWDEIVAFDDCLLASERGNAAREQVLAWARAEGLRAHDRRSGEGTLRNLVVREGRRTGEIMVRLVVAPGELPAPSLTAAVQADSLLVTTTDALGETTAVGETELLAGSDAIEEELADLRFRISPLAFFQTNTEMAERLYGVAAELADLRGPERLFDLYCGSGTIGLVLSAARRPGLRRRAGGGVGGRCDHQRAPERHRQRALLRGRRAPRPARARRAGGPPRRRRGRSAPRGPEQEGRPPGHRGGAAQDRLRLLQPDHAGAQRGPARRGRVHPAPRAAGGHVPPDAAHRVRRRARALIG